MNDNVIKFPKKFRGKKVPKIVDLDANKLQEDLDFCDNLAEGLMITLIHNIGENGFNIKSDRFIGDISFLNEAVRGTLYRQMKMAHPIQDFLDLIVKTETNGDNQIITKVKLDTLVEMMPELDNGKEDDTS